MKEGEVINISGNFVIYSSLLPHAVSDKSHYRTADCFTLSLTLTSFHRVFYFEILHYIQVTHDNFNYKVSD